MRLKRHTSGTQESQLSRFDGEMRDPPPTVRQVYALAAILCQLVDEEFPKERDAASELIERFRRELGHPRPRLGDSPVRARRSRRASLSHG